MVEEFFLMYLFFRHRKINNSQLPYYLTLARMWSMDSLSLGIDISRFNTWYSFIILWYSHIILYFLLSSPLSIVFLEGASTSVSF